MSRKFLLTSPVHLSTTVHDVLPVQNLSPAYCKCSVYDLVYAVFSYPALCEI